MIPRVKVNYRLTSLIAALKVAIRGMDAKKDLVDGLRSLFGFSKILLTPSGRAGLYFILRALDKSRVLIPAYTCKAVVEAALLAGKEIVYIKSEDGGFNMDPEDIAAHINSDSVIVATHQFGIPCNISRIVEIARSSGAIVIEDAAASFGTRINGRLTGTFADVAFFSFDSTKTIHVPLKGGFVMTNRYDLYERIVQIYQSEILAMPIAVGIKYFLSGLAYLILENHLLYKLFHLLNFQFRGRFTADNSDIDLTFSAFYRFDMSQWQAYLAWVQITNLHSIEKARKDQYAGYRDQLERCHSLLLPPEDSRSEWVCTRFPVRVRNSKMDFYNRSVRHGVDMAFSFTFIAAPTDFLYEHRVAGQVLDLPYYFKLKLSEMDEVVRVCRLVDSEREK